MYMQEEGESLLPSPASPISLFTVVIAILAGSTILLGVFPGPFLEVALETAAGF